MDPLTQILLQRAQAQPTASDNRPEGQDGPIGPSRPLAQPMPVVPPNTHNRVPPAAKRFANAQQIMEAYRQGWSPNPVLLQASLKD